MEKINILLIAFLSSIFITSCSVDDNPQRLESDFSNTPYVVGFNRASDFATYVTDGSVQSYKAYINLLSGEQFNDTPEQVISFEIDPSSTAVAGTHYNITTTSNSVTIDENRDFTFIDFDILTENLSTDSPVSIVVNITNTSNGVVGEQFKTMVINLQGSCFSNLGGSYTLTVTSSSGGSYSASELITDLGNGQYHTTTTGTWGPGVLQAQGATNEWFYFNDICNQIIVPNQNLADGFFSNTVTGINLGNGINGNVDPNTGIIHIEYTISFAAGNVNYSADYVPN